MILPGMTEHDLQARIGVLEDLEAIRSLKSRYALAADKCLCEPSHAHALALAELFTEDAVADYAAFGRFEGRAGLLEAFGKVLPGAVAWSIHYMANPIVHASGDQAAGTWSFLVHAVMKGAPPGPTVALFGHYADRYVKTAQGWKLAALTAQFVQPPG